MKKSKKNTFLYSAVGVATGVLAAGTYMLLNKDNLFGNKQDKKSLEKLQDIVQKSKTNVEDILRKMNTEASNVKNNGKAKLEKML